MSLDAELADIKSKFDKSFAQLNHEFMGIRTGRATTAIVENVQVEAYGSRMPLPQCASVSVPDATTILIKPWDKTLLKFLERALSEADLGMTPQSDGLVIRMNLPPLSTERRKQLATQAKEAAERAKVSMRNVRRDGIKHVETKGKDAKMPEDLIKKTVEKVGEMLKEAEAKIEKSLREKTEAIMTI
jgi:ribosome recycling factor